MSLPARPHLPMSLRGPPKEGRGNLTVPLRANEYAEIASSSARGGLLAMTRKGAHCMCPRPHPPQSERPFPRKRESRIPPFPMSLPALPHLPMSLRGPPKEGRGNLTVPLRTNEYPEIASSSFLKEGLAMTFRVGALPPPSGGG